MNKSEPEYRYATRAAILTISEKFKWPFENSMQDWPLEVSDKIDLDVAIREYPNLTDDDEKFVLMQGILYALDGLQGEDFDRYSIPITKLLKENFNLHQATIHYWTLYNTDFEDGFRITPLMRNIWDAQ